MTTTIRTGTLAGLTWWHVRGRREEAFTLLGQVAGDDIHAVVAQLPEGEHLRSFAATERGKALVDAIVERTRIDTPTAFVELASLAAGAGLDLTDALLANLRGDLGGSDGTGCSDITWRRGGALTGHNEDGAAPLDGRLGWLTLEIEGDQPVTTLWYPGFVPANAFAATASGLVWGINHVQIATPAAAAGRYFVARCLQQRTSLDEAVAYLTAQPCAGGLAYNIGEMGSGRVVSVESAAGRSDIDESDPAAGARWHTNHLCRLHVPEGRPADPTATQGVEHLGQRAESEARGRTLERLTAWSTTPTVDDMLKVLAGAPHPDGVHRSATGGDPLMMLCSTVADLHRSEVTIRARDGHTVTMSIEALLRGPTAPI